MKELWKYIIIGLSIVISAYVLGKALTYRPRTQNTLCVTGLGETEFTSDKIVWEGTINVEASDLTNGYREVERNRQKVAEYIASKGISSKEVTFNFVNVNKLYRSIYNSEGNYAGSQFAGYSLSQQFSIESSDVETVETVSREISSLIAKGVNIDAMQPEYYYTHLDDVKQELIEKASKDALARARNIASNAGASLGKVTSANLGVFQITDALGNDEYTYGGAFNTSSKDKKGRITVRVVYRIK